MNKIKLSTVCGGNIHLRGILGALQIQCKVSPEQPFGVLARRG